MKVFITLEIEKDDTEKDIQHIQGICLDFNAKLATNDIPTQFKITSLPRINRYQHLKSLKDLEN